MNCTENSTCVTSTDEFIILMNILCISVYSVGVLFGLPTFSYIIWHIITGTGLASEFFFLNLSFCEIGVCLFFFTVMLNYFLFSPTLMTFLIFLQGFSLTGRPLFECLMCVERYLAVVHPVIFLKYKPLRYKVMCCTAAWIICLGSCFFFMFIWSSYYIFTCFLSVQFLVFLCIQLSCCVAVLRVLKQSGPGERGREREEENHMKKRAFYLILIATLSMFITYVPCTFSGFLFLFSQNFRDDLSMFSFSCFVLGGFVMPVLYLYKTGKLFCLSS